MELACIAVLKGETPIGTVGYGKRKFPRRAGRVLNKGLVRRCGCLFLDSGAHSLYHLHTLGKPKGQRYDWYVNTSGGLSKAFRKYLDNYALFVTKYLEGVDYYVTVDAIYNPEISWQSLHYLEDLGLSPMPVIHHRTPLKWVDKHVEAGYKYVGLGGLGQESTRASYTDWADKVFAHICPAPTYLPAVKTHGFAMSSYSLMVRYPWYSVDSASWAKAAGFGNVFVPHKRGGRFDFADDPYVVTLSGATYSATHSRWHYRNLRPTERNILCEWLDEIGVPLGKIDKEGLSLEYGVLGEYNARAVANLRFFTRLAEWLPPWPWPFKTRKRLGFF